MEFNKTVQEARSKSPLPSLCFSGQSKKQDGRPGLWLAETFSTSPLKPLGAAVAEWLSSWLVEQKDRGSIPGLATWIFRDWLFPASKSRYDWKIAKSKLILITTNQPTSDTAEQNSTKLDRKQDLNVLYQGYAP